MTSEVGLAGCRLVELPLFEDKRGKLGFLEEDRHVPFAIARVYYLFQVPAEATRAGHAHRRIEEVIVALTGSLDVVVDDGRHRQRVTLDRPNEGLYIPTFVWHEATNFSPDCIALGLASLPYDPSDHIRDHGDFLREVGDRSSS